jgi:hypothetical protein
MFSFGLIRCDEFYKHSAEFSFSGLLGALPFMQGFRIESAVPAARMEQVKISPCGPRISLLVLC